MRAPWWLVAVAAAFLAFIVALLLSSLLRPEVATFRPTVPAERAPPTGLAGPDTVTLDARAGEGWIGLDLGRRRAGPVAEMAESWDLAAQRHRLAINGGEGFLGAAGVLASGESFQTLAEAPRDIGGASRVTPGADTVNATLRDWYSYSFLSHLLEPKPVTYVIRTAEGRYAKLRILGYYCPGAEPGCVTMEYVYQGDGSRRLRR
jgi:hypothetical protein